MPFNNGNLALPDTDLRARGVLREAALLAATSQNLAQLLRSAGNVFHDLSPFADKMIISINLDKVNLSTKVNKTGTSTNAIN
jgi:hypothetical protein